MIDAGHRRLDQIEKQLSRLEYSPAPTVPQYDLQGFPGGAVVPGLHLQNETANINFVGVWKNFSPTNDLYIDFTVHVIAWDTAHGNPAPDFWVNRAFDGSYNHTGLMAGNSAFADADDVAWYGYTYPAQTTDGSTGIASVDDTTYHYQMHLHYSHTTPHLEGGVPYLSYLVYVWDEDLRLNGTDYGTVDNSIDNAFAVHGPFEAPAPPGGQDTSGYSLDHIYSWGLQGSGCPRGFLPVFQSIFLGTTGWGSDDVLSIPDCSAISLPGPWDGFSTGTSDGAVFVVP